jgi:hypothetical protein
MPAQGLYEYLLLHKPWQPPPEPQGKPVMMSSDYEQLRNDRQRHAELLREVPVLRVAAAAEQRSQQDMLDDLLVARQTYQLDQVRAE